MTPPVFLDRNLNALKRYLPLVFEWLTACNLTPELRLMTNRRGEVDWPLPSGKGLFDSIQPNSYYDSWIPRENAETGATVIVGCNVGYGVNHVLTLTPDAHKVIVVDPRAEMVTACLSQTDYSQVIASGRLLLLPP